MARGCPSSRVCPAHGSGSPQPGPLLALQTKAAGPSGTGPSPGEAPLVNCSSAPLPSRETRVRSLLSLR